jgi:type II secretory pathway component GspD/PulD (secretin)
MLILAIALPEPLLDSVLQAQDVSPYYQPVERQRGSLEANQWQTMRTPSQQPATAASNAASMPSAYQHNLNRQVFRGGTGTIAGTAQAQRSDQYRQGTTSGSIAHWPEVNATYRSSRTSNAHAIQQAQFTATYGGPAATAEPDSQPRIAYQNFQQPPPLSSAATGFHQQGMVVSQGAGPLQVPPEPSRPQSASNQVFAAPDGTMTFSFKDAPWELVLRRIAHENRMSLQMSSVPPGTFTFFDDHAYLAPEAIDILNDHLMPIGFVLVRSGRNLVLFTTRDTIPNNLIPYVKTTELPGLGRTELASVAIPVHEGIVQSAEQEVEGLLSPLGAVTALSSSRRILVRDTGANLRRIYELMNGGASGAADLPSFVYQLRHTSAEEVARAINEFLAGRSQPQSTVVPGRPTAPSAAIPQMVVAEKTTNSLLVRGTPQELETVRSLITQLDQSPPQVLIQALLVEVELGNADEFGVELGIQDSVLFDRSVIDNIVTVTETMTTPGGNQTTNQRIVSQTAAPGFNFNNQPLGNNVAVSPGRVGGQALSNFGVGRVNGDLGFGGLVLSAGSDSVNVLLRALAAKYKIEVLSRPQIRTLDNHEALIQIGRQVPVVDGVSVTAVGSANPVIRQDQSGIILKVTPRISPDGQVLIDVNAEKSAFQLAPGTGVPIFTDATNGNVIEAPVKDITTATTTVSMQTSQTIALGGMITRDLIKVRRKVPWLGDIPYAGELFQYRLDQKTRKELLIFLTPHIIESPTHSDELLMRESNRVHIPYDAAIQMHGELPRMCPAHGHQPDSSCSVCRGDAVVNPGYSAAAMQVAAESQSSPAIQQTSATINSNSLEASPADNATWTPTDDVGPRHTWWKPFSSRRQRFPQQAAPDAPQQQPASPSTAGQQPTSGPVYIPVTNPPQQR